MINLLGPGSESEEDLCHLVISVVHSVLNKRLGLNSATGTCHFFIPKRSDCLFIEEHVTFRQGWVSIE